MRKSLCCLWRRLRTRAGKQSRTRSRLGQSPRP
jgi:hypothetical protein